MEIFNAQGGVATTAKLLDVLSRRHLQALLESTAVERVWRGIYSLGPADEVRRLKGLDLAAGEAVPICLSTAARVFGFDTEGDEDLHVLNPSGHQLRPADGLVVHRRDGAPLTIVGDRPAVEPAWTAVEVARGLLRPRALATLDAALRSGRCDRADMARAAKAQAGRRGIVVVRDLLAFADGRAESPMESEARLVMLDGGLPSPVLQWEIVASRGRLRRLDFSWPEFKVAAEYDGVDWHGGSDDLRRDRERLAALQDLGWIVIPIIAADVRIRPEELVARIEANLRRAQVA